MRWIEQRFVIAQDIVGRAAVMAHGEIVFDDVLASFVRQPDVMREWPGVG
jgi:branched-chain amino acid transport system ATP-binding protein